MPLHTYPYELPPLPYAYNALEPYIDAETMHYHHDKHFHTYVENLNAALLPYPKLQKLTLRQLLSRTYFLAEQSYTAILHNAGGVYNHMQFFQGLAPAGEEHGPSGMLLAMLNKSFGSLEACKKRFTEEALGVFGSGWAALALTTKRRLKIISLANQETVVQHAMKPILLFDVWEHAYYLTYKNARAEYIQNLWNVAVFRK